MKFSEHTSEARASRNAYINQRWKQLADLQNEVERLAATYLMVTNAGGAVTVLSFMGAMRTTTPVGTAPAMLLSFVLGLVFVGIGRALAYYRISTRYSRWRNGVKRFYQDEWTWEELIADDESLGWNYRLGEVVAWAAFGCFLTGVGLGISSLP